MSAKFIAAVAFLILALTIQSSLAAPSISRRSAIQNQCLQENAQDHKAYLSCIREKKAEQKNATTAPIPPTATGADTLSDAQNPDLRKNQ